MSGPNCDTYTFTEADMVVALLPYIAPNPTTTVKVGYFPKASGEPASIRITVYEEEPDELL